MKPEKETDTELGENESLTSDGGALGTPRNICTSHIEGQLSDLWRI